MTTHSSATLWSAVAGDRHFLVPDDFVFPLGSLLIKNGIGESASVAVQSLGVFEVTEEQARRWAKDELGQTLDDLKQGIDEKLADWRQQLDEVNRQPVSESSSVNRNAASALYDLLTLFPSVLGNSLSGEKARVESATTAMADLQRQLKEAGIDLDDRFTNFPDRLADLRKDYEEQRATKKSNSDGTTSDQR
jgi:hypothetical protein